MFTSAIQFVRPADLARELGIARSTLQLWRKRPGFPRVYRLGPGTAVFRRDEVRQWIERTREPAAA